MIELDPTMAMVGPVPAEAGSGSPDGFAAALAVASQGQTAGEETAGEDVATGPGEGTEDTAATADPAAAVLEMLGLNGPATVITESVADSAEIPEPLIDAAADPATAAASGQEATTPGLAAAAATVEATAAPLVDGTLATVVSDAAVTDAAAGSPIAPATPMSGPIDPSADTLGLGDPAGADGGDDSVAVIGRSMADPVTDPGVAAEPSVDQLIDVTPTQAVPALDSEAVDAEPVEPVTASAETLTGQAADVESVITEPAQGTAPVAPKPATAPTTPITPIDGAVDPLDRVADVAPSEATPAPSAPSGDSAPLTPAQQVAAALREVRQLTDGSHRLSLQLHPEELGAVQLEIALRDGRLHLRAVAETEATRGLLTNSLPELRGELNEAGVATGSLEVGADSAEQHAERRQALDRRESTSATPTSETTSSESPEPEADRSDGRLDVRI